MLTDSGQVLVALDGTGQRVAGNEFLKIAERLRQVVWGAFSGFSSLESMEPWIHIIAFDSTWFEVHTNDGDALRKLAMKFNKTELK